MSNFINSLPFFVAIPLAMLITASIYTAFFIAILYPVGWLHYIALTYPDTWGVLIGTTCFILILLMCGLKFAPKQKNYFELRQDYNKQTS